MNEMTMTTMMVGREKALQRKQQSPTPAPRPDHCELLLLVSRGWKQQRIYLLVPQRPSASVVMVAAAAAASPHRLVGSLVLCFLLHPQLLGSSLPEQLPGLPRVSEVGVFGIVFGFPTACMRCELYSQQVGQIGRRDPVLVDAAIDWRSEMQRSDGNEKKGKEASTSVARLLGCSSMSLEKEGTA
jgi:hypothetical protein